MEQITKRWITQLLPQSAKELTIWDPFAGAGDVVKAWSGLCGNAIGTDIAENAGGFPVINPLKDNPRNHGMPVWMVCSAGQPDGQEMNMVEWWHHNTDIERIALYVNLAFLGNAEAFERVLSGAGAPSYVDIAVDTEYAWIQWERGKNKYQQTRVRWF